MKTALVLGFSGSFGLAMSKALLDDNYKVTALIRNSEHKNLLSHTNLSFIEGDIFDQASVQPYCESADIIVYGINMPYYQWQSKALLYLETLLKYCQNSQARLVFPGNIYAYEQNKNLCINEQTPKKAPHILGEIRLQMETQLLNASKKGLNILIMRAGNYFGEHVPNGWLNYLISQKNKHVKISATSDPDAMSNYAYLPDLATTTIALLKTDLSHYEEFCFAGTNISFNQMKHIIQTQSPLEVTIGKFPWSIVSFMSLFVKKFKHLKATQYLFENNVSLDGTKIAEQLPKQAHSTDFITALKESKLIQF